MNYNFSIKIKCIALFVASICSSILVYKYFFKPAVISKNDTLIIGTASGYAPFVSVNEYGEYEGFDIDVAQNLARVMNKKLIIKDLGSMTSLFMALEQGSIDAIIWGMSITQDRLEKVAMVHYQGESVLSYPLLFWNTIPSSIAHLSDMDGMTVCVEPGSVQEMIIEKYPLIEKKSVEKIDDALLNIQYGKADAALVEEAIAKKFKNKYPEVQIVDVPLALEDQALGNGIVIKKDNTALIKEVEHAVSVLKKDGSIAEYEQKWNIAS